MEDKESTLLEFIHELTILLPILNKSATGISKGVTGKPDINNLILNANNILEITDTINTHLTLLNIDLNKEFYANQMPQLVNIHGAFTRCIKFLKSRIKAKDLKVNIIVNTQSFIPEIECLKIICAAPYIILDNCIKYSVKSGSIEVEFTLHRDSLHIAVSSDGPKVKDEELIRLTEKGYRGENAKKTYNNGKGLGLYYLRTICDLSKVVLLIESSKSSYFFNDTEYSTFSISLEIPINYHRNSR